LLGITLPLPLRNWVADPRKNAPEDPIDENRHAHCSWYAVFGIEEYAQFTLWCQLSRRCPNDKYEY